MCRWRKSLQYQECYTCSTSRKSVHYQEGCISSMRRWLCSVIRECSISEGLHLQWNHRVSSVIRNSVVSARSDLWYEDRKSAVPGGSLLHYKEKVVQCEEKLYSIRMVHVE